MGTKTKKYDLTFSVRAGIFAALCLVLGLFFSSPVLAATVEQACAIDAAKDACRIFKNNRDQIHSPSEVQAFMKKGNADCINPFPTNVSQITEEVCCRNKTANGCGRQHHGLDLAANYGTNVTAAAQGKILKYFDCYGAGGHTILMQHKKTDQKNCYITVYMHLSEFAPFVTELAGKEHIIKKGTVIGKVGGSKCTNGSVNLKGWSPHLHIEIRDDPGCKGAEKGNLLNPLCGSLNALCDKDAPVVNPPIADDAWAGIPYALDVTSSATLTGCGKMYSENNLSEFYQHGESGGNAGAFNKCWSKDKGGCSYGAAQMVCYKDPKNWNEEGSTVGKYLKYLQQNDPKKYKALEVGGSLQNTIKAYCDPKTAPQYAGKWQDLANSDSSFKSSQTQWIKDNSFTYGKDVLKRAGMGSLLNRSPEVQMIIFAGSVAGAGPMLDNFKEVKKALAPKTLENATDEEIITAYYNSYADVMYKNYPDKTPFSKRAAVDKEQALESLAIRKEMANGKTLEEASQAVTGKRACAENEYPDAKVTTAVVSGFGNGGGGYGGSSGYGSEDSGSRDCSIANYRNSFNSCIFCDIFGTLFNTASVIAKKSFNALAHGVMILVCVGFAIWLGIVVMKFVSAMEQVNPSSLIKTILNKAFLILIVVTLLRMDSVAFFKLAMEPLFNTGFKMAQMVNAGMEGETCKNTYHILTEAQGAGLPESMGVSILCTIETIQGKILDVMALGSTSICVALFIKSWHHIPIFPDLAYLFTGVFLWLAAFMLMIIYPFLLIDSVLQLCIATALLPAAIGSYAFKFTQNYSKKMWDVFLNCMFNFLFLSIIIFILTNGLNNILPTGEIFRAGSGVSYEVIIEELPWWSPRFIQVIFYLLLGGAVLGEANSFAGKFAKGIGIKDIGSYVGTTAAHTATQATIGTTKGAYKVTTKAGGLMIDRGRETYNNIKTSYNNFRTRRRANRIENSSRATIDADGNRTLRHRTWYGRRVTDTLQTAADGTRTVTRTRQSIFGSRAQSVSNDRFIRNRRSYDENGNLIREEFSMNTAAGRTLLNRDGTRNEIALHAIRSGSGMSNDDIDKAVMQQMMQERMGGVPNATLNNEFKERNVSREQDENGREVFTVTQTNTDGSTSIFRMTKGDKRDMLTVTHISKNGRAQSYSSDGIINKKSSYKVGADGKIDEKSVKNNYAFAKNFNSAHTRSMDSNGRMNRNIPADQIMMSDEDMRLFREQIATYGKDQPMTEFGK